MINNSNVIMPKTYEELTHQAKMILSSKRLLPREKQGYTVAEIESIIQIGQSYNLTPWQSVQAIMIVNGQASVWGDFLIGLVWASGKAISIEESSSGSIDDLTYVATCTAKREKSTISRSFSVEDAQKAGLWGKGPIWKGYPARMLHMRARSWCLRDGFSDVTKGLIAVEEAVDYKPLNDEDKPNIVEQKIIETLSSEPIVEKVKKEIKHDIYDEDKLKMLADKVKMYDVEEVVDDAESLIKEYLASKKAPMSDLLDRAETNFSTFFPLILNYAVSKRN